MFLDKERFPASDLEGLQDYPFPGCPWVCVVLSWVIAASRPNKLKEHLSSYMVPTGTRWFSEADVTRLDALRVGEGSHVWLRERYTPPVCLWLRFREGTVQ